MSESESASTENEVTADDLRRGDPAGGPIDPEQQGVMADQAPLIEEQAQRRRHECNAALQDALRKRDDACRAAAELRTRVQALVVQLDHQRSVAANAARERDDYGIRLIDAEHRAAVIPDVSRADEVAAELAAVRQRVSELEAELRFTHGTLSWRVTGPLRSLRTRASGRNSG